MAKGARIDVSPELFLQAYGFAHDIEIVFIEYRFRDPPVISMQIRGDSLDDAFTLKMGELVKEGRAQSTRNEDGSLTTVIEPL